MALDERLRRELELAARPADPTGVYEALIRRRERRRITHRIRTGVLAVAVIAGTIVGIIGLSRMFRPPNDRSLTPLVPVEPTATAKGLVAFTTNGGISVQAADGSKARDVPAPAPGLPWHIAWSPDGRQLAVAVFGEPGRSLWVMRADGSNATKIAEGENVSRPSWHPDGVHLVYSLERDGLTEVHVTRSDGSDDRVVYSDEAQGTYAVFSALFSPDGSQIAFDAGTDVGYDIFVMDADGSRVQQITHTGTDYNPSWSPNGSRILFTQQESASESDIFEMDADGSNVRRLTDDNASFTNLNAEYAPDGTTITYEAARNGGTGPIIAMNPDGSDRRTLVESDVLGFSWQPVPIPDGTSAAPGSGKDIGLGFPVCNVSSRDGHFVTSDQTVTAFVATMVGDTGACPQPEEALNVVALDADGDGRADTSYGPIECILECRTFSVPDLDADGTDELLIVQAGGSVLGLGLFDIALSETGPVVTPVTIGSPGDPAGGFRPGDVVQLLFGGDEFSLYAITCGDPQMRRGPGLIVTAAESRPHDSPDALWHVHQSVFALVDGSFLIMDIGDFTEPVGQDPPSFASAETLCGSNLGP